jgi:hypothetical protein
MKSKTFKISLAACDAPPPPVSPHVHIQPDG